MSEQFSITQKQRLSELNATLKTIEKSFDTREDRDEQFKQIVKKLAIENKESIVEMLNNTHKPLISLVEDKLKNWLSGISFSEMKTPHIIPESMLNKMTIDEKHHLHDQVFWLGDNKCLRPMLAPNLYVLMRDLHKSLNRPIKIYECGTCFRKESQGSQHLNEFTMLNLVEYASAKDGCQLERLKGLASGAMQAVGIENYETEIIASEVYGETLDIVINGLEIASGAYGPHSLDENWGVFGTWVGLGIGIERVAMVLGNANNIKRVGRSISYVNGARINL